MSIAMPPRTIHQFWGEEGTGHRIDGIGHTLGQEVSSVCDDRNDNAFLATAVRFPQIDEDAAPLVCLVHEYPAREEAR